MLKSLVAAVAMLVLAGRSAWAGAGEDFCKAMRQGYQDCGIEAAQPDANGNPAGDCPNAKNRLKMQAPQISANTISELRTQIQLSYDQWLPLANGIAHSGGMSEPALADLKRDRNARLNAECNKLLMLDY
jgi:hypothetical protein